MDSHEFLYRKVWWYLINEHKLNLILNFFNITEINILINSGPLSMYLLFTHQIYSVTQRKFQHLAIPNKFHIKCTNIIDEVRVSVKGTWFYEIWRHIARQKYTNISNEPAGSIFRKEVSSTLNMEAADSSKTSVNIYQTTRWHVSKHRSLREVQTIL
jgi:hypothetical protein